MRKHSVVRFWSLSVSLAASVFLLAIVANPAVYAQEKPIELTYGTYLGEKTLHSEQARIWAREVQKRTNGRVKVTRWVYAGGICGSSEQLGCIARGLADLGYIASSYYPAELRLSTLTEMIFTSNVPGADVKSRIELYETFPALREEFRAAGVEIVPFHSTATGIIATSKRKTINSSSDLKGIKAIRTRNALPLAPCGALRGAWHVATSLPREARP